MTLSTAAQYGVFSNECSCTDLALQINLKADVLCFTEGMLF